MKKHLLASLAVFLLAGAFVHAEVGQDLGITATIPNPFACPGGGDNCTLTQLFTAIAQNIILPLGGVLAVLAFIWAGFMFVTAQGDEGKLKTAKTALLYTAIGTVILLGAVVIANVLETTVKTLQ